MNKPFKTVDEQIEILENRNIIVSNKRFARQILTYENYYYVINGYKTPFINSTNNGDAYKPGTSFNEIVALYSFDRKLRELLMPELLRIEHCIKAIIIDVFSKNHGEDHTVYLRPEAFNVNGFNNFKRVNALIFELLKLIDKQRKFHNAVQHYMNKYGSVPLWVLSKVMTFGKINSFYGCMCKEDKEKVAATFNLSSNEFKSLIDFMAVFRNKCAHGERIYCHIKDQKRPTPISNLPLHELLEIPRNRKGYKYGTQDIFALLIAMKYFLHSTRYEKLIRHIDYALNRKLARRLKSISCDEIRKIMGLGKGWQNVASIPLPTAD